MHFDVMSGFNFFLGRLLFGVAIIVALFVLWLGIMGLLWVRYKWKGWRKGA